MKKIFFRYADYNLWANQKMVATILNLTDEQIHREIVSSFPSIYKTLLHLCDSESIWWQRMKLIEVVEAPSKNFNGTVIELCNKWLDLSKQWKEWAESASEAALEHEFIYRNIKRIQFKQPVYEVLHQLFNHQSYHRGQLVTMFRQLGIKEIPSTDLILYYRKK